MSNNNRAELDRQYAELMQKIFSSLYTDTEVSHIEADQLLCKILLAEGYEQTVAAFSAGHKWYA